jgi:hypothetical protein
VGQKEVARPQSQKISLGRFLRQRPRRRHRRFQLFTAAAAVEEPSEKLAKQLSQRIPAAALSLSFPPSFPFRAKEEEEEEEKSHPSFRQHL